MARSPNAIRVAVWTITLIGLAAVSFIAYGRFGIPSPPVEPFTCRQIPPNIVKLGPTIVVHSTSALPEIEAMGWPELRTELRQGDALRAFETHTTGGHLAMRGNCYLGQAVAWMR